MRRVVGVWLGCLSLLAGATASVSRAAVVRSPRSHGSRALLRLLGGQAASEWTAHLTEDGRTYYFHAPSGTSSWDPPPVEPAGGSAADQWSQHVSDAGETFFYNAATGETSWQLPAGASLASADGAAAGDAASQGEPSAAGTPSSGDELPGAWSKHTADDGRDYYYNAETGASSWEPPRPEPTSASAASATGEAADSAAPAESLPATDGSAGVTSAGEGSDRVAEAVVDGLVEGGVDEVAAEGGRAMEEEAEEGEEEGQAGQEEQEGQEEGQEEGGGRYEYEYLFRS